jgi:hypothetical protein
LDASGGSGFRSPAVDCAGEAQVIGTLEVATAARHEAYGITLTRIIFVIFSCEVILFGAGAWLQPFGIVFRKVAFILLVALLFCYSSLVNPRVIFKNTEMWLAFVGFFVIWGLIIPLYEQRRLMVSFADFAPLLGLGVVAPLAAIYRRTASWHTDKRFLIFALNLLASFHVAAWIYGSISPENGAIVVSVMRDFLEPGVDIVDSSIFIGYTIDGTFRVHWGPSVFLLLGLYFSLDIIRRRGVTLTSALALTLQVAAIATTQSRGFWAALAAGGLTLYFGIRFFPRKDIRVGVLLCLTFLFGLTFLLLPFYSPDFLSAVGLNREGSDDIRSEQALLILDQLWQSPVFGIGFGGGVDLIRSEAAPYSYEVSILALYMKLGLIGTVWAFTLSILLLNYLMRNIKLRKDNHFPLSLLYATVFGFVFSTNSNPYLSNFFGMTMLTVLLIELQAISEFRKAQQL